MRHRGVSLIEMLFVLGVIALLFAIAVPVFNGVRGQSRTAVSAGNLRQWGAANTQYVNDNEQRLPWEGLLAGESMPNEVMMNFEEDEWWANSLPRYMDGQSYADIFAEVDATNGELPLPPDRSVFCDPEAEGRVWEAGNYRYYFSYLFNSGLHADIDTIYDTATTFEEQVQQRVTTSDIRKPAVTVLMFEQRDPGTLSSVEERIPADIQMAEPYYSTLGMDTHHGTWDRMASRHRDGGQVVFLDGSVKWFDIHRVLQSDAGNDDSGSAYTISSMGDWNKPDLIWNPLGPALAPSTP